MNVRELIVALQKMDPDLDVIYTENGAVDGDCLILSTEEVEYEDYWSSDLSCWGKVRKAVRLGS